jgi:hypothetical protein
LVTDLKITARIVALKRLALNGASAFEARRCRAGAETGGQALIDEGPRPKLKS